MQIESTPAWSAHPQPAQPAPGGAAAPRSEAAVQRRDLLAGAAASAGVDPARRAPEEQAAIAELKRRDQEVRQHEAAHLSAGGAYVRGGARYSYQAGPDGKRYAVGGEVSIDTSAVANNPEATAAKMQAVRAAALAPANPSGQDLAVAAQATQAELQARMKAVEQAQQDHAAGPARAADEERLASAPAAPARASPGALLDAYA